MCFLVKLSLIWHAFPHAYLLLDHSLHFIILKLFLSLNMAAKNILIISFLSLYLNIIYQKECQGFHSCAGIYLTVLSVKMSQISENKMSLELRMRYLLFIYCLFCPTNSQTIIKKVRNNY